MSSVALDSSYPNKGALDHLALDLILPWHEQQEQQEKFKRLVKRLLIPIFAFMIVMSILPNFFEDEEVEEKIVAQVILEAPKVVETPPAPSEPPPEHKTQSVKKNVKPKQGTKSSLQNMAALSQQMSALRNSIAANKQQKKNIVTSNNGKVQKSSRSRLGQESINTTSGGLKASDITVNAKGAALQDHTSDDIESPLMNIELPDEAQYHYDPKKQRLRDMQNIRPVMERLKGAVYALYNKALRKNPDLGGRFVFAMTILPNGKVEGVKVVSSELEDTQLEQSMLKKIQQLDFGVSDTIATKLEYAYSFTPS